MTTDTQPDQVVDENVTVQTQQAEGNTADDYTPEDNDPMIVAMREAEAEIKAADTTEGAEEEATDKAPDPQIAKTDGKPAAQPATGNSDPEAPVMVPKARLDAVLADRDRHKEQAAYYKGIADTRAQMLQGPNQPASNDPEGGQSGQGNAAPAVETYEARIEAAENEKIAIAQKYEDGEISFKEAQEAQVKLDRQIRTLDSERVSAMVESAKQTSVQVVQANNRQIAIETEAMKVQEAHPYIAAIDKLPKAISDGVWQEITNEAIDNLKSKGIFIDPNKPLPADQHLALIKEKAALTNKYGPQYAGKIEGQQQPQGQPGQMSETAQQRLNKMNVADSQPPVASQAGYGADTVPLTEKDIENMSQDELADYLVANPTAVNKAAGFR